MLHPQHSPYERALGARITQLHPVLQKYFVTIPEGHIGVGIGVFDRVGTTRRWLRPLLVGMQRRGVLVAGLHENVPFRVVNRTVAGRAIAERTLELPGGSWVMQDSVALKPHGRVVDELGEPAAVAASFDVAVSGDALQLTSHAVGLMLGGLCIRVPRFISPVVYLTERFDDVAMRQHVDLSIHLPLMGRIYEYSGSFTYRIEKES